MIRGHQPRSVFLDRRLAALSRKRAGGDGAVEQTTVAVNGSDAERMIERVNVQDILAGEVLTDAEGTVFLHEQLRSSIERPRAGWGRLRRRRSRAPVFEPRAPEWLEEAPWRADYELDEDELTGSWEEDGVAGTLPLEVLHEELESLVRGGLGKAVYLDLETCGLTQACVFLAGTMQWNGEDFVLRQYLARDYAEERALVSQLMIDESTAVGTAQQTMSLRRYGYLVAGIAVFVVWNVTTVLGAAVLSSSGDLVQTLGLDAAIPAVFLALVWPRLVDRTQRRLAVAGAAVALVLTPITPAGIPSSAPIMTATRVSSSVAGKKVRKSASTARRE